MREKARSGKGRGRASLREREKEEGMRKKDREQERNSNSITSTCMSRKATMNTMQPGLNLPGPSVSKDYHFYHQSADSLTFSPGTR